MSNQSDIPKTLGELKALGYPKVIEREESDGGWTVSIEPMLSTANGFPGALSHNYTLDDARNDVFKIYHEWMSDYVRWVREVSTKPIAHFEDDHIELMRVLNEIRDELRIMNKRPLYIVVNSEKAMHELANMLRKDANEVDTK